VIAVRAAAARAVAAVLAGRSLDDALAPLRERVATGDRALLQELAYGTVRHWLRLEPIVRARLRKPPRSRDADLHALLVVACYELDGMRTPAHAAVDAAVGAAEGLGKSWARGLINGVLRGLLRDPGALAPPDDPGRAHAWPDWLAAAMAADWPADWLRLAASGTERPPMTLRVNRRRGGREAYLERLRAEGIRASPAPHAESGIVLEIPVPVERLPGFEAGEVSVQDTAAQLAAPLLAPVAGCRVLDACAAPGGKTTHLAELDPPPDELVALEIDPGRAERLRAGAARVGADVCLRLGDAAEPAGWWDGRPFQRILLDVPCSGTGVVRRHPDIKLLRRAEDIDTLVAAQSRLLDAVWPLLAPGGMLLYVTCSVLRRENADQVAAFLARRPGAEAMPIDAGWGRPDGPGRQILPGEDGMDGFFYACLRQSA